jgi:hypothetical protein
VGNRSWRVRADRRLVSGRARLAVLAIVILAAFVLSEQVDVSADADVAAPVLSSVSLAEPGPFRPGDTVGVDFSASDASGISVIEIAFVDPLGGSRYLSAYNTSNGTATATIGTSWAPGTYTVTRIMVYAAANTQAAAHHPNGTITKYPSGLAGATTHTFDFDDLSFTVGSVSAPSQPLAVGASAAASGPGRVAVSFDPPADDGGSPITEYRARCTSTDGGVTRSRSGTASPVTVIGLSLGATYRCEVRAVNIVGLSPFSYPLSEAVVPFGLPGAPGDVAASAGTRRAEVTFAAPAADGGRPVLAHAARCTSSDDGVTRGREVAAPALAVTVTGLTAEATYRCAVRAKNEAGWGPWSSESASFLPFGPPGAPSITSVVVPTPWQASVAFESPTADGGQPVTAYAARCTSTDGGVTRAKQATASPITVGGMTVGATYVCDVRARNDSGWGPSSDAEPL